MSSYLWLRPFPHRLFGCRGRKASSTRPAVSSRRRVRPCLETLEDRITPSSAANAAALATLIQQDNTNNTADTILLTGGVSDYQLTGQLEITDKAGLTIQGHGQTIDASAAHNRAFLIDKGGTNILFQNLTIQGGVATDDGTGGTKDAEGGGILDKGGNVTLSKVVLQNNFAKASPASNANGGGIYVSKEGSLTIQSSVIQGGGAVCVSAASDGGSAFGGGVYTSGATIIANSKLSNNTVTGGNSSGDGLGGDAEGGGVDAEGVTTIKDSTLSDNTLKGGDSQGFAGGRAFGGSVFAGGNVNITDSTLSGNTLTGGKGSISNNPRVAGSGWGYVGGSAAGGSVFVNNSGTTTITESTLSGNTLTGGKGSLSQGKVKIAGDIGGDATGGGVYASNPASISLSNLSNNTLNGGAGSVSGTGSVQGSVGGSASGGGLYAVLGSATVLESSLSGNTVTGGGGAVFVGGIGRLESPGRAQGGGVFMSGASATLTNATIAGNQVIGGQGLPVNPVASGGGLFFHFGISTLTNVTVADNKASLPAGGSGGTSGGGIDISTGATVTLVNALVALNSATSGPDYNGAVTNSDHNLIGDATGSTGFSAANHDLLGTTGNLLNPQLGPLTNNGGLTPTMALLPGSPAINTGDTSAQSVTGQFDQRGPGFARVVNGAIDIGAFEVQPPPPPTTGSTSSPAPPPTLHTPALLAFIDALLGGIETVNSNDTETVTDSFFGIVLFVSTYDSNGNLMSVTIFGINITFLFASVP